MMPTRRWPSSATCVAARWAPRAVVDPHRRGTRHLRLVHDDERQVAFPDGVERGALSGSEYATTTSVWARITLLCLRPVAGRPGQEQQ